MKTYEPHDMVLLTDDTVVEIVERLPYGYRTRDGRVISKTMVVDEMQTGNHIAIICGLVILTIVMMMVCAMIVNLF